MPAPTASSANAEAPVTADRPLDTNVSSTDANKGIAAMATAFNTPPFAADNVQNLFGDMRDRAKTSMEKGAKVAEELGEFAKGNVEAFMTSGRVAAKGVETLGQEAVDYGKKSFESASNAVKGFAAAKSPTELFQLQSDYARSSFDAMVAEGSRVTEAWVKLAGEVMQPLSTRLAVAAEKVKAPTIG
ncbi:phasin family protein [Sphingomonas sp.]|uniref:phasin family protein n=1 Tax=Sphingomonas sp. TaxID=28214 RepID=UPI003B00FA10